uniref:Uncharacterized protein n=1 Tax=Panagrolaimus sp. ES5 TaxID=591445 RepID=A0AC34FXN5_9BILA
MSSSETASNVTEETVALSEKNESGKVAYKRQKLQKLIGGQITATEYISDMLTVAIQASTNPEQFAFIPAVFFFDKDVENMIIINYNRRKNKYIFIPYCKDMKHRLFVYEKTLASYSTIYHIDPFGMPTPLEATKLHLDIRPQVKRIVDSIEKYQTVLNWVEPFIPLSPQQLGYDGVGDVEILILCIQNFVDGKNPLLISSYNDSRLHHLNSFPDDVIKEKTSSIEEVQERPKILYKNSPTLSIQQQQAVTFLISDSDVEAFIKLY